MQNLVFICPSAVCGYRHTRALMSIGDKRTNFIHAENVKTNINIAKKYDDKAKMNMSYR